MAATCWTAAAAGGAVEAAFGGEGGVAGKVVSAPGVVPSTVGGLVQAGVVHGGVHLHAARPPTAPVVPRQLLGGLGPFVGRLRHLTETQRTVFAHAGCRVAHREIGVVGLV